MQATHSSRGSALIESLAALTILSVVIVTVTAMVFLMTSAKKQTMAETQEATVLTSIQGELNLSIVRGGCENIAELTQKVAAVVADHPGWHCELTEIISGLVKIVYVYDFGDKSFRFESRISYD